MSIPNLPVSPNASRLKDAEPASIFRAEALRHRFEQGHRRAELNMPRLMSRPAVALLWGLLGLLGLGGGAACFVPVPATASGLAVFATSSAPAREGPAAAVLLSPEVQRRLRPGQDVTVHLGADGAISRGAVIGVEPEPLVPTEIQKRLGLSDPVSLMREEPVIVAWVGFPQPVDGTPLSASAGPLGRADIAIGSQRAGAFLPLVGRLFGE